MDQYSPLNKRGGKTGPRRSMGIPAKSEWERYKDGFDVPQSLNKKVAKSRRRLSNFLGPKVQQESESNPVTSSQVEISGFSSEDDDLQDIQPILDVEVGGSSKSKTPVFPEERRKHKRKLCLDVEDAGSSKADAAEFNILADSPRKSSRVTSAGNAGEGSCNIDRDRSENDESESPCISVAESSQNSPLESNKPKTSEWLRNLEWSKKSPQRSYEHEELSQEDSAKKKKSKYERGGLAERLQKLVTRRKSDITIWHHSVTSREATPQEEKNCLIVQILDKTTEYSVCVCRCRVLPQDTEEQTDAEVEPEEILVLFSVSSSKKLSLEEGTTVMIYPPWQSLMSEGKKIILCTQFCRKVPTQSGHSSERHQASDNLPTRVLARWRCPCLVEGSSLAKECVALSSHPGEVYCHITSVCSHPSTSQLESRLHTTVWSQFSDLPSRGILESIEEQGLTNISGISIQGTVQRIFHKNVESRVSVQPLRPSLSASGWSDGRVHHVSVLVQDDLAMCCEVILPCLCETMDGWRELLHNGEGKVWCFHGLRQQCRTNKRKSPGLFQMIEAVFPKDGITSPCVSSQEESQQSDSVHHLAIPQSFCYRLVATTMDSSCRVTSEPPYYRQPGVIQLDDITTLLPSRVSFGGVVIYKHIKVEGCKVSGMRLYVMANSKLPSDGHLCYIVISVSTLNYISPPVLQLISPSSTQNIVFKDIRLENGVYYCDEYSQLCTYEDVNAGVWNVAPQQVDIWTLKQHLPLIMDQENITEGDLGLVSGCVTDVDNDSAFTRQACDICHIGDLTRHREECDGQLYCEWCKRDVPSPLTLFNLEVYLTVQPRDQRWQMDLKIKLQQSTIKEIMPEEDIEGGYDLQPIKGKPLQSIPCVVLNVIQDATSQTRTINLEEIVM